MCESFPAATLHSEQEILSNNVSLIETGRHG
jgi:hypothetical protein